MAVMGTTVTTEDVGEVPFKNPLLTPVAVPTIVLFPNPYPALVLGKAEAVLRAADAPATEVAKPTVMVCK